MYFSLRAKLFLVLVVLASALSALAFIPVAGRHGMVASSEPSASEVGVQILREGGNAVDAAVAVGFALAVTHPVAGNIGGGGFMLIRLASGEAVVVDYREAAPAAASRNMYVNSNGEIIPHASTVGVLSAGVPGTVAGLALAEEKYGKLGLARAPPLAIGGGAPARPQRTARRRPHGRCRAVRSRTLPCAIAARAAMVRWIGISQSRAADGSCLRQAAIFRILTRSR